MLYPPQPGRPRLPASLRNSAKGSGGYRNGLCGCTLGASGRSNALTEKASDLLGGGEESGGLRGEDGGESTSSSGELERTDRGDWGDGAQQGLPQREAGDMPSGRVSMWWCSSSSSSVLSILSLTKRLMPNLISSVNKEILF